MLNDISDVLVTGLLRRSARLFGARTATFDQGIERSWEQFEQRVARLAGALLDMGLLPGDRVALLADNSAAYLELMFAVPWAGGIIVPINTRLSNQEIVHCVGEPDCTILLCDEAHVAEAVAARSACSSLRCVLMIGNAHPDGTDAATEDMVSASAAITPYRARERDVMGIFYTGGTTGRSKGAMLSHANMIANSMNLMPAFRFTPHTRNLNVSPMFHIAATFSMFGPTIAGGSHFFLPKYDPVEVLASVRDHGITFFAVVPTMIKRMVECATFSTGYLKTLTDIFYGGSPTLETDLKAYCDKMPGIRLHQGYGLTETSPTIAYLPPERHVFDGPLAGKTTSVGQPVPLVDIGIVSSDGCLVPAGEIGEICVRGATVMQGYWGRPEESGRALRDGWFHTGDVGMLDEDGFLSIIDRIKDMIISGGENIYSIEVEEALLTHPEVVESAVIGIPSTAWGEEVHAVVRVKPDSRVTAETLLAHCREQLARYKCPKSFELTTQPLPLSSTNKIAKAELRQAYLTAHPHHIIEGS